MTFRKASILATLPIVFASFASADEIMVTNQPAGTTLTIASVTISYDGWLVIHAMVDGKPVVPASIGHVAVKAGTTENVVVELSEPVAAGDSVLTMLHTDKGVIGEYEFPGADTPVMQNSKPVVKPMLIE